VRLRSPDSREITRIDWSRYTAGSLGCAAVRVNYGLELDMQSLLRLRPEPLGKLRSQGVRGVPGAPECPPQVADQIFDPESRHAAAR